MPIATLISHLQSSEVGQIYWANLCMQYELGVLDKSKSKLIFSNAANDRDFTDLLSDISKYGVGDASIGALTTLIKQSEHNAMAIDACAKDTERTHLPAKVSTVMSAKTFVDHCLSSAGRTALTAEWIRRMALSGKTLIPPIGSEYLVLKYFYDDGARDQNDIPGFDKFLQPQIQIRTRELRFWMAGDPKVMPTNADDVRDILALGYLNPGDVLVRISLSQTTLLKHLSEAVRRPSAFCVNDIVEPRFRGRHSSESSAIPVIYEFGMTANLSGGTMPSDGTHEWICPSIAANAKDIHVELLGAVDNPRAEPNNAQFAAHLTKYGSLTPSIEQTVIDEICTP